MTKIETSKVRGLYAIVDATISKGRDLVTLARDYVQGGAALIQLRDKGRMAPAERRRVIEGVLNLKKDYKFLFILNDDVDLACEMPVDGLHIGKDDGAIASCRERLGPKKIIGYSSHSLAEAREAEQEGADYVAFGAIFPTATKGPGHPVQGLKKLENVVTLLKVPVVAIGGIGRATIDAVLKTGAPCAAMISALSEASDRVAETRFFAEKFS
jgi:thiamine-phosphate diphosphorylase